MLRHLNSSLSKVKTYVGEDGKLHFIDSAGADTALPFSNNEWEEIKIVTLSSDLTINLGRRPKELFVGWSAANTTTSHFNLLTYYNENFSECVFGGGLDANYYVEMTDTGFKIKCKYSGRPIFYAYK